MSVRGLPPKPKELHARIDRAVRENRIEMASNEERRALEPHVECVLQAIGFPGALVTDESCLSDFLDIRRKDHRRCRRGDKEWTEVAAEPEVKAKHEIFMQKLQEELGVVIGEHDYIVDIARSVKNLGLA